MIVFDICGTLYDSNTTLDFCAFRSTGKKRLLLILSKTLIGKALNKVSIIFFGLDFIRQIHIKSLNGIDRKILDRDAAKFVSDYLIQKQIQKVHQYLSNFKPEDIILVSATIEPIAKAIAEKLGGLKYKATTLKYDRGICTGEIAFDLLGNKHKIFSNVDIEVVITDNKSDTSLCEMAKSVIVVSKDKNIPYWKGTNLNIIEIIRV